MKKILAIALVLVMMLSLVACGNDSDADKVAAYVNKNKAVLLSSMEESFAGSSGLTCTSDIKAVGCGIVIDININELDNVDASVKATMQETYDSMSGYFDIMLTSLQKELPEVDSITINVNEIDGDPVASIKAD